MVQFIVIMFQGELLDFEGVTTVHIGWFRKSKQTPLNYQTQLTNIKDFKTNLQRLTILSRRLRRPIETYYFSQLGSFHQA